MYIFGVYVCYLITNEVAPYELELGDPDQTY